MKWHCLMKCSVLYWFCFGFLYLPIKLLHYFPFSSMDLFSPLSPYQPNSLYSFSSVQSVDVFLFNYKTKSLYTFFIRVNSRKFDDSEVAPLTGLMCRSVGYHGLTPMFIKILPLRGNCGLYVIDFVNLRFVVSLWHFGRLSDLLFFPISNSLSP